jgi:hypothetical protein
MVGTARATKFAAAGKILGKRRAHRLEPTTYVSINGIELHGIISGGGSSQLTR